MIQTNSAAPLLIVDFMVMAWRIKDLLLYRGLDRGCTDAQLKTIIKCLWAYNLNRGPSVLDQENWRIVVISDRKDENNGYWRTHLIASDERMTKAYKEKPQGYKSGRPQKDSLFMIIVELGQQYCFNYLNYWFEPGYEADDWAGAIYREVRNTSDPELKSRKKILFTIDRDWTQLVDDSLNIIWVTSRQPRTKEHIQTQIATEYDVLYHTKFRYKKDIKSPLEIAQIKSNYGDASDNLPSKSPIEYITLSEPHPSYQLESMNSWSHFQECLSSPWSNIQLDHLKEAKVMLDKLNLLSVTPPGAES